MPIAVLADDHPFARLAALFKRMLGGVSELVLMLIERGGRKLDKIARQALTSPLVGLADARGGGLADAAGDVADATGAVVDFVAGGVETLLESGAEFVDGLLSAGEDLATETLQTMIGNVRTASSHFPRPRRRAGPKVHPKARLGLGAAWCFGTVLRSSAWNRCVSYGNCAAGDTVSQLRDLQQPSTTPTPRGSGLLRRDCQDYETPPSFVPGTSLGRPSETTRSNLRSTARNLRREYRTFTGRKTTSDKLQNSNTRFLF